MLPRPISSIRIKYAIIAVLILVVLGVFLQHHMEPSHEYLIISSQVQEASKSNPGILSTHLENLDVKSIPEGIKSKSHKNSKIYDPYNASAMPAKEIILKSKEDQGTSSADGNLKLPVTIDPKIKELISPDTNNDLEADQTAADQTAADQTDAASRTNSAVTESKPQKIHEFTLNKNRTSNISDDSKTQSDQEENDALLNGTKSRTYDTIRLNETYKHNIDACVNKSVVTFNPKGRLGNRICEFIHLVDFQETHSYQAFLHPDMWKSLHGMFPHITMPLLSGECMKELKNHKVQYQQVFSTQNITLMSKMFLMGYPCSVTQFWKTRSQWRRELQFSPKLQENAKTRRMNLVKNWQHGQAQHKGQQAPEDPTVVGVHVRRGDYRKLLTRLKNEGLLPPQYYQRAFQYFRERYDLLLIIIITEPSQRQWCRGNLANGTSDVLVVEDSSTPEQDLALLASMEHIIYSHGTFGLTAILLSDVKTLVYSAENTASKAGRYALHLGLDDISKNWTSVNFVTVSSTER